VPFATVPGGVVYKQLLIAAPALVLATSCVPQTEQARLVAARLPPLPAPVLLQQLDLNVPVDLMRDASGHLTLPMIAPASPFLAASRSPEDATRAIDCLTAAVYYEARSQSVDGQRAVAQVVLNRVRDRAFPASVCGVVYQGSHRSTGCQFTFTCDGSLYQRRDPASWERARTIATQALGGTVYAPVGSATFYHANYVSPWWAPSLVQVATVGAHIFYRWPNAMERSLAYRQRYSGAEPLTSGGNGLQIVSDITVHRGGTDEEGGVTVHRGLAPAVAVATPATAAAAPRPTFVSGVRIHRGEDAPLTVDATGASEDSAI